MISSFYTAATGMINLQKGFDVTANNIANASTTGFKSSQTSFADLVYTNISAAQNANTNLKSGHGAKLQKTDTLFEQGILNQTNRSLDFALPANNTFFAIQTDGKVKYTRNGNFHLSMENGKNYLASSDGGYVLDAKGQKITVSNEEDTPAIGVFTFQNTDGLVREGSTYFMPSAYSGQATAPAKAEIKKGYLENSSVNLSDEMISVIGLQKAFQFNSKIIQMSDEIMQTVNSLR
jgi:flagellar basal-body rod protein FlgG